jgi:hypothetical protein
MYDRPGLGFSSRKVRVFLAVCGIMKIIMINKTLLFAVLAALFTLPVGSLAAQSHEIRFITQDYGISQKPNMDAQDWALMNQKLAEGSNFFLTTEEIPLQIGVGFGLSGHFEPVDAKILFTVIIDHPTFDLGNGEEKERTIIQLSSSNNASRDFIWVLEEEYELVPGTWTFGVWYKGELLESKSFELQAESEA